MVASQDHEALEDIRSRLNEEGLSTRIVNRGPRGRKRGRVRMLFTTHSNSEVL